MSGRGKGGKGLGKGGAMYYAIPCGKRNLDSIPTSYRFKEMIAHRSRTENSEDAVVSASDWSSTSCAYSSSTSCSTVPCTKGYYDIFAQLPATTLLQIMSYLHLEDYRDLARFRQISKGMQSILPQYIRETIPYCPCSFYGGTSATFFGNMIDYCSSFEECWVNDFIGGTFDVRRSKEEQEESTKTKKSPCLFQGCDGLQTVTVLTEMEKGDGISKEEEKTDVATAAVDIEKEYARLCREILAAKSFERFQQLSKEAAMKEMFLPLPSPQNDGTNDTKRKNKHSDMYLAIVTLKISPEELANPTCYRRGAEDGIYYLRACDLETYKELKYPCLPCKEDLSLEFRAYQLNLNSINHGQETDIDLDDGSILVGIPMRVCGDYHGTLRCPSTYIQSTSLLNIHQHKTVPEGVAIADEIVPPNLHNKLIWQIDQLSQAQKADYHPHSNNMVRDLVHPALYAYVKGVSKVISMDEVPPCQPPDVFEDHLHSSDYYDSSDKDYWGRKYEDSAKYQWLPTYFDVAPDGSCHICDYINSLVPRQDFTGLYTSLEELFSQALPLLESTYSYGRFISTNLLSHSRNIQEWTRDVPYNPHDGAAVADLYCNKDVPRWSLKGQRLQVITKIVDYELDAGQKYEGVWHVEGMSHEEIVATAIYILERDENIVGGNILFKRAIHASEAGYLGERSGGQQRPYHVNNIIKDGTVPLGQVETLSKRLIAFPNSHIHKVTTLKNKGNDADAERAGKKRCGMKPKRRIVVFFLINPEKRIISTREVPPQQIEAGGSMTYEDACEHRLELMRERKYTKQDWNVREISIA